MQYPLNKIFQTLQGEGFFTGIPAIFIRLQGCPVTCSWCDTKYTWEKNVSNQMESKKILEKKTDNNFWANFTTKSISSIITKKRWSAKHVVITGGEPCLYNLMPLIQHFEKKGFNCQIETSGTQEVYCTLRTWVTVSPKINMKSKLPVLLQALNRSDEIKYPVARQNDIDKLEKLLKKLHKKKRIISLQPISQKRSATQLCIDTCLSKNWRLSIQTHKYLNIE